MKRFLFIAAAILAAVLPARAVEPVDELLPVRGLAT